jgi:adenosine kinase
MAASSSSKSKVGRILGMGNPLLDISCVVPTEFLAKYDLRPSNAILAEEKHLPMYAEMSAMPGVEFIGGGSTLNSIRVAQWFLNGEHSSADAEGVSSYMGCIGNDEFGETMRAYCKGTGVDAHFCVDGTEPTGTCAVCIVDKERSMVANLAAANKFQSSHMATEKAVSLMEHASIIYSAGFFLTVSPESMMIAAEHCLKNGKRFAINLSAEFITQFFADPLMKVMPLASIVFCNEDEAKAFATKQEIKFGDDLAVVAQAIAKLPTADGLKFERMAVITQGADRVIVSTPSFTKKFGVRKLSSEKIVDLNGAGDAFVGGFLARFSAGSELADCVSGGVYCAQHVIQRSGTSLAGSEPSFDADVVTGCETSESAKE